MRPIISAALLFLVVAQAYAQGPSPEPKRYDLRTLAIRNVQSDVHGQFCVIITMPYPDGSVIFYTEHGGEVRLDQYGGAQKSVNGLGYDHWFCFPIKLHYEEASRRLLLVQGEITHYAYLPHFEPRAMRQY